MINSPDQNKDSSKPKKHLGQNFLSDKKILEKIVNAGDIKGDETVVEIGPGRGSLTRTLLSTGVKVIAVEKDEGLVSFLKETFAEEIESKQLTIIEGDVLEERDALEKKLKDKEYKVIANIPYYITGKILRFIFSLDNLPSSVVLLIQDEVAKRIVSDTESILSLSIKAFGTPVYRGKVKAGSFFPAPKVDSAILAIENISRDFFTTINEADFFKTIRRAFSQKRKTLLNTLFAQDKERGKNILNQVGLEETTRPQEVPLETWQKLLHLLYEKNA
ncbi:MAG: 16S rRNA (adenine(1518)-N(6)/adenine(1519)-N(6))-dimethyltransferase RsmA [Candidatus Campbellbacteria bacterium]|nr:16S rRNA (adenine(1518)-N(6)/adenine(1519)-N(6))-dimethyltransferase RsmA [Candidatus Campbellbacteria bacterium]